MTDQLHLIDAPGWGPQRRALLADNRTDSWRFELLDRRNRVLRELRGIRDFEMTANLHAEIRTGGSCVYQGAEEIDWTRHRIRAWIKAFGQGRSLEWCVGTFVVEAPTTEYTAERVTPRKLQLLDMMSRVTEQASTAQAWTARKGANVIQTIRALLDTQSIQHSIEDSDAVFGSTITWPPGTSYLRMVNDMLEVANFFSVWADPMGILRAGPYRRPQDRGTTLTFRDDDTPGAMPFLPAFTHERDIYGVPSQMTIIAETDDPDELPMVGTALDTTSPFSWEVTGRRISARRENVAASRTQAEMDARAWAELTRAQQVGEKLEVSHPYAPIAINDVAGFTRTGRGIDVTAVVEGYTYAQGEELSKTTLRGIVA